MERDRRYMARAFELARRAEFTHPNPRVGCVIVRDDEIVGEGWHEGAGHPHAEAVALSGTEARGAALYVTLEPCAHHGRTPPCVEAIIGAGVGRVVAAAADPDELVAGKGLAALDAAGIEVEVGVLAEEAEESNAPYLHHRRTGSSFVTLKLALSLDGGLAAADGSARWITGNETRRAVHGLRHRVDAVMVGSGTALADDPELTVRDVPATRQPLRIVLDGSGRLRASARLFSDEEVPVLIATSSRVDGDLRSAWSSAGAEVVELPDGRGGLDLRALLKETGAREIVEILCEGGAELASSLVAQDLVNRLDIHFGPVLLGAGAVRLGDLGIATMSDASRWQLAEVHRSGDDVVTSYSRVGSL